MKTNKSSIETETKKTSQNEQKRYYDIEECQAHKKATSMGEPFKDSSICECCHLPYQKMPIKCTFSSSQIEYCGEGLSLYFEFMKMCTLIAFLAILTCSIPNMILNANGQGCTLFQQAFKCSKTFFIVISVANKIDEDLNRLTIQHYLIILPIAIIFILIQLYRKRFQDIEDHMQHLAGPQNYAVIGSIQFLTSNQEKYTTVSSKSHQQHINNVSSLERQIQQSIYEWFRKEEQHNYRQLKQMEENGQKKQKLQIQKIIISFDISEAKELVDQLAQLREEAIICFQQEVNDIASKLEEIGIKANKIQIKKNNKFIVIFSYEKYAKYFVDVINRNCISKALNYQHLFFLKKRLVRVENAPLPSQILWQNHHVGRQMKFFKRFCVLLVFLIALFIGEGLIFIVLYFFWYQFISPNQDTQDLTISVLISLFIVLVNFILYQFFIFISKFEHRMLLVDDHISKCVKLIFTIFLNQGILLFCAYYIIEVQTIWVYNGFVDTLSYTFIFSIITPHLFKYINLQNIFKLYYNFVIRNKNPQYSQKMANQRFQRPQGLEAYHYYAWMVTMLWLASFFASMVPLGFICIFLTFLIHLILQKLNYTSFYKERKPWGSKLNTLMIELVEFSEFLFLLGHIITVVLISQTNGIRLRWNNVILHIVLSLFILAHIFFLPKNLIVRVITCYFCRQKTDEGNMSYSESKDKFITTFEQERRLKYDGKNTKIDLMNQKAVKLDLKKRIMEIESIIRRKIDPQLKAIKQEATQMHILSQRN